MSIEQAKQILKDAGYFVDNLWHVSDVKMNYKCTNEEAFEVLFEAFENECTYTQIWNSIDYQAEYLNLERK